MSLWALFLVVLQGVVLAYSGWGSVAVVKAAVVDGYGALTSSQLVTFLALSQATPGPLGFYLLFVGYAISGPPGAAVTLLALVLPSALVIPIQGLLDRGRRRGWLEGGTAGLIIGSAALMLSTALDLSATLTAVPQWGIAAGSFGLLIATRLPSFAVVVLAAAAGFAAL